MLPALAVLGSVTSLAIGTSYAKHLFPLIGAQGTSALRVGERVLTTGQNVAFERLVGVLDKPTPMSPFLAGRVQGGDGPTTQVDIHNENHFVEAVDLDLFNQRQDFAVRAVSL